MKNNYKQITKSILISMVFLLGAMTYAQDINFTFANAQNTNDGTNDFYEVDVMIQTVNATADFKLGSGQLYFNYNTAAFGTNVSGSGSFEVTYPNAGGYICGQFIDFGAIAIYGSFTDNDNTPSRVSWNFAQTFSSSTFAANNVTATSTLLVHLKIQYVDVLEEPMVTFEDDAAFDDQFFTACGSGGGGATDTADCTGFPGTQIVNDTFDNTGATLSDNEVTPLARVSIYPNPTSSVINISSSSTIDSVELFDLLGKRVLETNETEQIEVSHLPSGIYLLKVYSNDTNEITKKIVIE